MKKHSSMLWQFVHHFFVHPLLALSWGRLWAWRFHDWTARLAWPMAEKIPVLVENTGYYPLRYIILIRDGPVWNLFDDSWDRRGSLGPLYIEEKDALFAVKELHENKTRSLPHNRTQPVDESVVVVLQIHLIDKPQKHWRGLE